VVKYFPGCCGPGREADVPAPVPVSYAIVIVGTAAAAAEQERTACGPECGGKGGVDVGCARVQTVAAAAHATHAAVHGGCDALPADVVLVERHATLSVGEATPGRQQRCIGLASVPALACTVRGSMVCEMQSCASTDLHVVHVGHDWRRRVTHIATIWRRRVDSDVPAMNTRRRTQKGDHTTANNRHQEQETHRSCTVFSSA
jgi:hypothetical protein